MIYYKSTANNAESLFEFGINKKKTYFEIGLQTKNQI